MRGNTMFPRFFLYQAKRNETDFSYLRPASGLMTFNKCWNSRKLKYKI